MSDEKPINFLTVDENNNISSTEVIEQIANIAASVSGKVGGSNGVQRQILGVTAEGVSGEYPVFMGMTRVGSQVFSSFVFDGDAVNPKMQGVFVFNFTVDGGLDGWRPYGNSHGMQSYKILGTPIIESNKTQEMYTIDDIRISKDTDGTISVLVFSEGVDPGTDYYFTVNTELTWLTNDQYPENTGGPSELR